MYVIIVVQTLNSKIRNNQNADWNACRHLNTRVMSTTIQKNFSAEKEITLLVYALSESAAEQCKIFF